MRRIEEIPLLHAFKAVFAGLTFSLFTPNRIGEYGGRVLMVSKENRIRTIFATLVGSFSQWVVLVVGGWWAMIVAFYSGVIPIGNLLFSGLVVLGLLASVLLFFLYFNMHFLSRICKKFKWTGKLTQRLQNSVSPKYSNKELMQALTFSFLRYMTYSVQYLFLLFFFGFDASAGNTFLCIMIVYLLQTGIPLPPSTGLLARGNIALLIFGYLSISAGAPAAILASTFSLWIINVVLPAILGALFLVRKGFGSFNSPSFCPEPV